MRNILLLLLLPLLAIAAPNNPSHLVLTATSTSVSLSWQDQSSDERGFKIFRNKQHIMTLPMNVTHFTDTGLRPRTRYDYIVKATDDEDLPQTPISINEFMAVNVHTIMDSDNYEFKDWIELYNSSNHNIDIGGYQLADDAQKAPWEIPSHTMIPAKGYLLIWADKKDRGLHADFSLKDKGEDIFLYDTHGLLIDSVHFKKQTADVSYGRHKDTKIWGYMMPSPKTKNATWFSKAKRTKEPTFSLQGGLFATSQVLSIATNSADTVYYTLDGSKPDKSSYKLTASIRIPQTTIVKAIAYKKGLLPSDVVTETYFINKESSTLPLVSISINADYLYHDTYGIYVKGTNGKAMHCEDLDGVFNFAQEWERPAHLEYFDTQNQKPFAFGLDVSIAGECSRRFPKRSFSFELSKKYGTKKLIYPLYAQKEGITIKDFKLRGGRGGFMVTDILAAQITYANNLDIDYQAFSMVQMYMNGEYWGVYHIREKKGKDYIESNYPTVDINAIDIISVDEVKRGDDVDYKALKTYVQTHNLAITVNYQTVIAQIDLNNFIDYMSLLIYSGNQDWILNNTRFWKEKKAGGTWRWMLDDVDDGFMSWLKDKNNFNLIQDRPDTMTSALFLALSQNASFRAQFNQRFTALLDSAFLPSNMLREMNTVAYPKIEYLDQEKWAKELSRRAKTIEAFVAQYQEDIEDMHEFANDRRDIVKAQLKAYLSQY